MLILLLLFISSSSWSQDPARFQEEIADITTRYDSLYDKSKATIVFTGSSSIRTWEDLQKVYPDYQVVNSGFGGSHASDLLAYADELILRFDPLKVFIYEGDNDLAERKSPRKIVKDLQSILEKIWMENPRTEVVLIAAKPSLSRWHLRRKFQRFNRKTERMASKHPSLAFADVWSVMLEGEKINKDLFIEDGLHMNQKGYDIWKQVLDPFVK
ncbi:MAG: G-D-S-L family lipolytic protein [Eudoraea sp.]|nr:G-D-S-L family lipolytic protein [Eudoraea sp.]MBT8210184.1 G-D-S-L family lipolytic protein [Eudoraea sp.]NNK29663.1 G-D-S-L family lipolytic protein [Flavobacteriaceae bacterium]